jgi:hypothetical protein
LRILDLLILENNMFGSIIHAVYQFSAVFLDESLLRSVQTVIVSVVVSAVLTPRAMPSGIRFPKPAGRD